MWIHSWNVNGIRAVVSKDFEPWKMLPKSDVICLQETKAQPDQLDDEVLSPKGWTSHWHSAEKKGYSGTAIYTRKDPDEVLTGMGTKKYDCEGRVLGVRFGKIVVISAYFPNSQDKGARLDYKLGFCRAILRFQKQLVSDGLEVVLLGDYNIAHEPIDLARPKQNEKNSGYLPEERAWMSKYLKSGFRDTFRERNADLEGAYSWWSFRSGARERNVGWRIDYACVSEGLMDRVTDAQIHTDVFGSDHCPVSVKIKVP